MAMKDNSTPERFRNRKEALLWLKDRGQISQGKFYTDCAAGLLTIYPDKSLSKFQVAEYADKVFSFARQEPLQKTVKPLRKQNRRSRPVSEGLSGAGQGVSMGTGTQGAEADCFEAVDVLLKFDTPSHSFDEPVTGRGQIVITAGLSLTFTGDIQGMASVLHDTSEDRLHGVIKGALVELLGQEVLKGGCHVHN